MWLNAILRHLYSSPNDRRSLDAAQLEERVMMSASPVAAAAVGAEAVESAAVPVAQVALHQHDSGHAAGGDADSAADADRAHSHADAPDGFRFESSGDEQQDRKELVVIDGSTEDFQQLIDDLNSQQGDSPQFQVHLLESDRDGIAQISELLSGSDELDAIHVVSHGSGGAIKLGNSWLDSNNLSAYTQQLVGWQDALSTKADLLLYGCDLAGNQDGQVLVECLGVLTGADVAASTDETGHAQLGGDWDLEYHNGKIESGVAFSSQLRGQWTSTLGAEPVGGETLVNTMTANAQKESSVAMDAAGNYVVVWESKGGDKEIYFQRYDASGQAVGAETKVNSTVDGSQKKPRVAMDASGNFVVVWQGNGDQAGNVDNRGVFFQRFNADGVAQGSETLVNTTTADNEKEADVAMDAGGGFAVVWESKAGTKSDVYLQRFDADGAVQGNETLVNTTIAGDQKKPAIAMDADGNYVVAWQGSGDQLGNADNKGVFVQRYDALGVAQGGETLVNTTTTADQKEADVAMDSDGDFAVVWQGKGASSSDLYLQRYNAAGVAQGGETQVNSTTAGAQKKASIAMDASGDFVVAWEGAGDGDNKGVFAQAFDADGAKIGDELRANTTTDKSQKRAATAISDIGNFVLVWDGQGIGDNKGVFVQRYRQPANIAPDIAAPGAQSTDEETGFLFGAAFGNAISIHDVDAAGAEVEVTLTADHGRITLSGTTGLTFLSGDGASDHAMAFSGAIDDVNAALNGLWFDPETDFTGSASLRIDVDDLGNSGSGGSASASTAIAIAVNPVNDLPVATGESYAIKSGEILTVAAPGLLANDSDVDGDSLSVQLVNGPSAGRLTLAADGSFSYRPTTLFDGQVQFSYVAADGTGTSNVVLAIIDVEGASGPLPQRDLAAAADLQRHDPIELPEIEPYDRPTIVSIHAGKGPIGAEPSARALNGESESVESQIVATPYLPLIERGDDAAFFYAESDASPAPRLQPMEAVQESTPEAVSYVDPISFWNQLDRFQRTLVEGSAVNLTAGTVAMTSLGVTAGYLLWMSDRGYLLTGLISRAPQFAWSDRSPLLQPSCV